jgi:hypothetical protein
VVCDPAHPGAVVTRRSPVRLLPAIRTEIAADAIEAVWERANRTVPEPQRGDRSCAAALNVAMKAAMTPVRTAPMLPGRGSQTPVSLKRPGFA